MVISRKNGRLQEPHIIARYPRFQRLAIYETLLYKLIDYFGLGERLQSYKLT